MDEFPSLNIGEILCRFQLPLNMGKAREFALATGLPDPTQQKFGGVTLLPAFLATSYLYWPVDIIALIESALQCNCVHAEQEYEIFAPPLLVGQVLEAALCVTKVFEKNGRRSNVVRFVALSTEYRTGDDVLVARTIQTLAFPTSGAA